MLATFLLVCSLALHSWSHRVDPGTPQALPLTDEDLDFMEDWQMPKWLRRHPNKVSPYALDDESTEHLTVPRYLKLAQKRVKPKSPIYLGLIG